MAMKNLVVRLDDETREKLESDAKGLKMDKSEYIRQLIRIGLKIEVKIK